MPSTAPITPAAPDLLHRLVRLCGEEEQVSLGDRLADLAELVSVDLERFQEMLPIVAVDDSPAPRAVQLGATHLLIQGGKRLRPLCVSLAAAAGSGLTGESLGLAVAVELVHAATLLHDDVVDMGDTRRGAPATRVLFGNTVSVFAGDWLLVDALRRVRQAKIGDCLERLLDAIDEMILAESIQLEQRGQLDTTAEQWFSIVEGKTAALFRWGLYAGGRAGGLTDAQCTALETFGLHLGIAFQAIDDVLDFAGDPEATGKALFTDLGEGKLTYPLIHALEREPELRHALESIVNLSTDGEGDNSEPPMQYRQVMEALERHGSLDACRQLAFSHAEKAKEALAALPPSRARSALETVADTTVNRPS